MTAARFCILAVLFTATVAAPVTAPVAAPVAAAVARGGDTATTRPDSLVNLGGNYTTGTGGIAGPGSLLHLGRDGWYRIETSDCAGSWVSEIGTATMTADGNVHLEPHPPRQADPAAPPPAKPRDLLVVHWGRRDYLIESGAIADFVNAVNAGTEPRDQERGSAYLRIGDWKRQVDGSPPLPAPWDKRLLVAQPLRVKLASVDKKAGTATIGAGSDAGVFEGMLLYPTAAAGPSPLELKVMSVTAASATVAPQSEHKLRRGDEFSTRPLPQPSPR